MMVNNSHSLSHAEISVLSLDGQPSVESSLAAHLFDKSMKNINHSFNNKVSIIPTKNDGSQSFESHINELESQEKLSS